MTREEAIAVLQQRIDVIEDDQAYSMLTKSMYEDGYRRIEAFKMAIAALNEVGSPTTQLDENGLMPCGCGGKARIKYDGSYSSKCIAKNADGTVQYEGATVLYPGHTHAWVDCDNNKCECSVGYCGGLIFKTDEEARDAWNRAMGWREDK